MAKAMEEAIRDPRRPTDIIKEFEQEEEYSPTVTKVTPDNHESVSRLRQV